MAQAGRVITRFNKSTKSKFLGEKALKQDYILLNWDQYCITYLEFILE